MTPQKVQDVQDFLVTFLHPIRWTCMLATKWSRVDRLKLYAFWREERVRQRKLIVDFVESIGVEYHVHFLVLARRL
jgi:hypothetical protein